MPDLPAVYLLRNFIIFLNLYIDELNESAIKKLSEDAMNGLYDYFFVNLMKNPSPEQIDAFAYEMAKTNQAHKICRVQAHYLNYQVINSNMFVVPGGQGNFKAMYGSGGKEQEAVEQMAQGIYSLFKSINKVPIVRV